MLFSRSELFSYAESNRMNFELECNGIFRTMFTQMGQTFTHYSHNKPDTVINTAIKLVMSRLRPGWRLQDSSNPTACLTLSLGGGNSNAVSCCHSM